MTDIVEKLDEWTAENFSWNNLKTFGYCELITKADQPIPVVIGTKEQVSLDDRYNLITWVRLPGTISVNPSPDDDWGIKEARKQTATLRMIVAHKVSLGENFIIGFIRQLPDSFKIDGYQFVYIDNNFNVDADHESVYRTELGATAYEKHRFDWNVYAVLFNVEYIACEAIV